MAKKQNTDPLAERLKILDKAKKRSGFIYGSVEKQEKKKKKKKEKAPSWEYLYNVSLMHFQLHLYEIICTINDIPSGIYLESSRNRVELIKNMKLDDEFRAYSKLQWDTPYPIDGLFFRGRFATCVLFTLIRKSHRIVRNVLKDGMQGELRKKEIKKLQYTILDALIGIIDRFICEFLHTGGDYVVPLRKIEELLGLVGDNDPDIRYYIEETDELLHRRDEPGIEVNNITKVAYALATGSLNTKKCPDYNPDFIYSNDQDAATQVGELGIAILKHREKYKKIPVLYKAFQKANPSVSSRFYRMNQEAPEITVGLRALEFSKLFYMNDDRKNWVIDQLM